MQTQLQPFPLFIVDRKAKRRPANWSLPTKPYEPRNFNLDNTERAFSMNLLTSITNQGDDYLQYAKEAGGNRTMYLEGQLSYSRLLADNHQIDGLLLYNMRDYVNADAASAIYSLPYRTQGIAARLSYK